MMSSRQLLLTGCVAVALAIGATAWSHAGPVLFYNPTTGNLTLENDGLNPGSTQRRDSIEVVNLISFPGAFLEPSPSDNPGRWEWELGDLPHFIAYLRVPVGRFDLGEIVLPGTSAETFVLELYYRFKSARYASRWWKFLSRRRHS